MGMKVAKFGGSSLADAAQFKKVREILFSDADRRIVVPSAPGKRGATDIKVTDLFYQCNRLAASGSDFAEAFDTIRARYREIARELELTVDLDGYLDEVSRNIQLGAGADYAASRGEYLLSLRDMLLGRGERGFAFGDAVVIFSQLIYMAVLALFALDIVSAFRRGTWVRMLPFWGIFALACGIAVLTVGAPRYHMPYLPIFAMGAGDYLLAGRGDADEPDEAM